MGISDDGCHRRLVDIGKDGSTLLSVPWAGNLTHVRQGVKVGLQLGIGGGSSFRSIDLGPLDAVDQALPVLEEEFMVVSALVNSLG